MDSQGGVVNPPPCAPSNDQILRSAVGATRGRSSDEIDDDRAHLVARQVRDLRFPRRRDLAGRRVVIGPSNRLGSFGAGEGLHSLSLAAVAGMAVRHCCFF